MKRKNNDLGLLILRISIGFLMLFHGIAKFNIGGMMNLIQKMLTDIGIPGFISYGVFIGEIVAPVAMIAGFRTRIASIVFAVNCLVIIFLVRAPDFFKLDDFGGWALEVIGLYLLGSVALFFTGAGKYAISTIHDWD